MKKFKLMALVAVLGMVVFASCGDVPHRPHRPHRPDRPTVKNNRGHRYEVIKVDGCEYLLGNNNKKMAHKGDCANPIHCHNR